MFRDHFNMWFRLGQILGNILGMCIRMMGILGKPGRPLNVEML